MKSLLINKNVNLVEDIVYNLDEEVIDERKEVFDKLSLGSLNRTIDILVSHGEVLNDDHIGALHAISLEAASQLVYGNKGRVAFSLSCGAGKTTFVRGLIFAIQQLGLDYSIAVSAEKVEALCELKRSLVRDGIREESIGLVHSYSHDPNSKLDVIKPGYASEPSTSKNEWRNKQFILLTHNKIKNQSVDLIDLYKNRTRDLVIWDESLIISEGMSLPRADVIAGINKILTLYEERVNEGRKRTLIHDSLYEYLGECRESILKAFKDRETFIEFEEPKIAINELKKALHSLVGKSEHYVDRLLDFVNRRCRAINIPGGNALIQHDLVVPDYLDKVIILDASHPIRRLIHLDKGIKYDPETAFTKNYEDVTVHYWKGRTGRNWLEGEFLKNDNKVSAEVVNICNNITKNNPDEAILIFTYKSKGVDIISKLKDQLSSNGINVDMKDKDGRKIINFLTWGKETNLNSYAYCKHVILCGVLYLNNSDIAAKMIGQSRDDYFPVDGKSIHEIHIGEQVHMIYQALSRGNCRNTVNGKAGKMSVYLFHTRIDVIRNQLKLVMPEAVWTRYEAKYMDNDLTKQEELAIQIEEVLDSLDVDNISSKELKKEYFTDAHDKNWTRARNLFKENSRSWIIRGRSFHRVM